MKNAKDTTTYCVVKGFLCVYNNQMEKLADILDRSLKRLPLNSRLADYAIWSIWNDTVGPAVARNAQPEKIRNGILFVKVSAPTWMQQLQYMKELITAKINERLERPVVNSIFFMVGTLPTQPGQQKPSPSEPPVDPSRMPEEELLALKDPALQESLRALITAHLKRGREE